MCVCVWLYYVYIILFYLWIYDFVKTGKKRNKETRTSCHWFRALANCWYRCTTKWRQLRQLQQQRENIVSAKAIAIRNERRKQIEENYKRMKERENRESEKASLRGTNKTLNKRNKKKKQTCNDYDNDNNNNDAYKLPCLNRYWPLFSFAFSYLIFSFFVPSFFLVRFWCLCVLNSCFGDGKVITIKSKFASYPTQLLTCFFSFLSFFFLNLFSCFISHLLNMTRTPPSFCSFCFSSS